MPDQFNELAHYLSERKPPYTTESIATMLHRIHALSPEATSQPKGHNFSDDCCPIQKIQELCVNLQSNSTLTYEYTKLNAEGLLLAQKIMHNENELREACVEKKDLQMSLDNDYKKIEQLAQRLHPDSTQAHVFFSKPEAQRDRVQVLLDQTLQARAVEVKLQDFYNLHQDLQRKKELVLILKSYVLILNSSDNEEIQAIIRNHNGQVEALNFLQELFNLNEKITGLLITYEIFEIPQEDRREELQTALLINQAKKAITEELSLLCESYIKNFLRLSELSQDYQKRDKDIKAFKKSKQGIDEKLSHYASAAQQEEDRRVLEEKLTNAIEYLGALPTCAYEDVSPAPVKEPQDSPLPNYMRQINYWHHQIISSTGTAPEGFNDWYNNFYRSILSEVKQEGLAYRAQHALRDIYFELNLHKYTKRSVLNAYMSMAHITLIITFEDSDIHTSTYDISSHPLLLLKPDFSTSPDRSPFGPVKNRKLQEDLDNLYKHCEKLKSEGYQSRSELLFQATESLHYAALKIENGQESELKYNALYILEDPRYDRLKEHRGLLLKCWGTIEHWVRTRLGMHQPEKHGSSIYPGCLFKTHSTRLILNTEETLKEILPQGFDF